LTDVNNAIAACGSGQVVSLAAGTYTFSGQILFNNKSNVSLRGAGPDKTFLKFTAGGGCNGLGAFLCIMNSDRQDSSNPHNVATWTTGYAPGSTSITLGSVSLGSISNLHVGGLLILDQLDDSSDPGENIFACGTTACSWQGNTEGNGRPSRGQQQQVTVTSISGSGPWTIGISPGIYAPNWTSSRSPGAWWSSALPVTSDGIEDLSVDLTAGAATGAGIMGHNVTMSWVKNVRIINSSVHKHVWWYQCTHMTVRDSYFFGGTGTSENYGVDWGNSSTDNLTINNIFQHLASAVIGEGGPGNVGAYNFGIDNYYAAGGGQWQQADNYHHTEGDHYFLFEGNQGQGLNADDVHGTSWMFTAFRNYYNGRDPLGGSSGGKTQQTIAIDLHSYNRFFNIVGNVLGTAGYHTNYEFFAPNATDSGNATLADRSVYQFGYSGGEGTYFSGVPNDTWVRDTSMRWGNYDTVNAAVRWVNSEVPSGLAIYANPVPSSHNLPPSFFLPVQQPSWWATLWGTPVWPANGPDVTGGNIPNVGGHANNIPAQLCYANSTIDTNYSVNSGRGLLLFNANKCYSSQSTTIAPPTNLNVVVN